MSKINTTGTFEPHNGKNTCLDTSYPQSDRAHVDCFFATLHRDLLEMLEVTK